MDNMSQEKKSVVNPIRRQILISGATSPLVLTLMARNASAVLQRGAPSGAAPYSAAMFGSLRLDGTEIEFGADDDNSAALYNTLSTNESYYGSKGTGVITETLPTESTPTYSYTCTWTFSTYPGTGSGNAGTFAKRYEEKRLGELATWTASWECTFSGFSTAQTIPSDPIFLDKFVECVKSLSSGVSPGT